MNEDQLITEVRELLHRMTPEQRVEFIFNLGDGYCYNCGAKEDGGRRCQCENDE